jgi:hypothetical protein
MPASLILAIGAFLLLPGCIARTAVDVVTLPVKAVSGVVDATTTSESEADEKRGRELRKREEKLGTLERERQKSARKCQAGDAEACRDAEQIQAEMNTIRNGYAY